ncbi:MAG: hypothetical protein H6626_00090 [Pseudobdellovibrionaceae bacterium]|nr:hypothetical protein [Bdellovibrionales bacterium]USN47533.1 MAG: hypothetical protein H6626_00090 [Pseudobdellovibrionaceae bacterium]
MHLQQVPSMPRARAILQSKYPYNISGRCINREWFNLPMPQVWDVFSEELYLTVINHNLLIHSFVLMNNHFHLLASTPDANISQCMYRLLKNVSLRLTQAGNRINQTFAGRHYKTILDHPSYYLNAYKYNYRNPVQACMAERVEDYPYSTLHGLLGRSKLLIPLAFDDTLFDNIDDTLSWLNQKPSDQQNEAVRWALKRQYFKSKKDKLTNSSVLFDGEII